MFLGAGLQVFANVEYSIKFDPLVGIRFWSLFLDFVLQLEQM